MRRFLLFILAVSSLPLFLSFSANAWFDETHVAVAKVAGYSKWFNAAGPDMIKEKLGNREGHNHFVNNPKGTVVTPEMVLSQAEKYNKIDRGGHLYGAIIASVRDYQKKKETGKYGEYHLAFCAHYVADPSQPLHNIEYSPFNKRYHKEIDGVVDNGILGNLDRIKIYPITITSEEGLAKEIARIANLSMALGYRLEDEKRVLTREDAYRQLGHSASLFKAILEYVSGGTKPEK